MGDEEPAAEPAAAEPEVVVSPRPVPAEEGAAWNVLYPDHSVVIPTPEIHRPVGLAVRKNDGEWVRLLDRFLDFEEMDGTLQQLREYWVEGGGTKEQKPRWCVLRNVLHWLP